MWWWVRRDRASHDVGSLASVVPTQGTKTRTCRGWGTQFCGWVGEKRLFCKEWGEEGEHVLGDELGAFDGGVDAVGLDCAGEGVDAVVDHGHEGCVVG